MKFPPVLILCGGLATRLGELTAQRPKAMLEIARRPFIDHQLELLKQKGVTDVILCVGHLKQQIESHVGTGSKFGLTVRYSEDGAKLLGTGGATKKASTLVDGHFAVLYGDSYLDIEMEPIYEAFKSIGKPGLMSVIRNSNEWDASNVIYRNGSIVLYDKQNKTKDMHYIDYGLLILEKKCLNKFGFDTKFDLSELLRDLSVSGQLAGFEVTQRFYEIGSTQGIRETEEYILSRH